MALQIDSVQQACRAIAMQMRDYTRSLHLSFIVHRNGEKLESLSLAGQQLLTHPAGEAAMRLMRDQGKDEHSTYLGLALWNESMLLGLMRNRQMMALTTMNIDDFESLREIRAQAWHMAWHAIRHYQLGNHPDYTDIFDLGMVKPQFIKDALPAENLRADIFSALMCGADGDHDSLRRIAYQRCLSALNKNHRLRPEDYPFPLALEATQTVLVDLQQRQPSKKRQIHETLEQVEKIAREFDAETLTQWTHFCKPAQDMAWRGESMEMILGAAVCTSQNTFMRTTGFLISDILHIQPVSILALQDQHSPFADDRYNQRLHVSMIELAFERAASAYSQDRNGNPFIDAANEQNKKLSEGHIFGWCAAALQAAGRAFDSAMASGSKTATQDARQCFEMERHKTSWDNLKEIGEAIIEQYRHGYAVTFSDILEFCGNTPAFAGISSSIAFTLKDPAYLKKLSVANDVKPSHTPAFQAVSPMPKATAAPTIANIPRMGVPGLAPGGGGQQQQQQKIAVPPDAAPAEGIFQFEEESSK
jgi:hypothetical protein